MSTHILKQNSKHLQNLFCKLNELKTWNEIFAKHIDPMLAKHCQVVRYENDRLIVIVDNANWATQLRFHVPEIIPALRQQPGFENLQAICSKIWPTYQSASEGPSVPKSRNISKQSAKKILEIAQDVRDEKIRKILEKWVG